MATRTYVDIGAFQRKESGTATAKTSYVDVGAAQRQESTPTPGMPFRTTIDGRRWTQ